MSFSIQLKKGNKERACLPRARREVFLDGFSVVSGVTFPDSDSDPDPD